MILIGQVVVLLIEFKMLNIRPAAYVLIISKMPTTPNEIITQQMFTGQSNVRLRPQLEL
jgi:hypothetical protein